MNKLDKYILREMAIPFIAGFSIILVFFFGTVIYNNITLIVSRIKQWQDIIYLIFLQTQPNVLLALPSGTIFGCSLAISRLAKDSEITVMRIAGARLLRIFMPILAVGLAAGIIGYIFEEKVLVWSEKETAKVYRKIVMAPGPLPIQPNIFFKEQNTYFYINSVERKDDTTILRNVMIYEPPVGAGYPTLTTAPIATETNRIWTLRSGVTYRLNAQGEPELTATFDKTTLNLDSSITERIMNTQSGPRSMSISELSKQIKLFKLGGLNPKPYELEYFFKIALPLGSVILALCVAPLSYKFGKGGGFTGALIGIIIFFFYWQIIIYSRVIGEAGGLNPALAGWSANIIFGILGIILFSRMEKL